MFKARAFRVVLSPRSSFYRNLLHAVCLAKLIQLILYCSVSNIMPPMLNCSGGLAQNTKVWVGCIYIYGQQRPGFTTAQIVSFKSHCYCQVSTVASFGGKVVCLVYAHRKMP